VSEVEDLSEVKDVSEVEDVGDAGVPGPATDAPAASAPPLPARPAPAPTAAPGNSPAPDGWLRLNARALAVRPITDLLRSAPVLIGVVYEGTRGSKSAYWGLGFAVFAVLSGIWRWFGTRYQVTESRVYVRRGLLAPKVLSTPRTGVRSVDLTAHAIYRLLGVAEVKIGTGRNDKRDGEAFKLNALRVTDAEALRTLLLSTASRAATAGSAASASAEALPQQRTSAASPAETELVRLRPAWIRFAPLTLTGLVILGVLAGFVTQAGHDAGVDVASLGPVHAAAHALTRMPLAEALPAGALAALAAMVIVSVLGYIAVFWNFRLVRTGLGSLRVTRGLISTRATTIDEARLRGVELSEPLSLRAAGGARCLAITTGLRVGGGAERGGTVLLPPAPRGVAVGVAAEILGLPADVVTTALTPHGRAALRRRETRALIPLGVLGGAAALGLGLAGRLSPWWALSLPVLCVLGVLLGRDRYRGLGHALVGEWLILSTGSLVRRRSILHVRGVVGWRLRQSWFQRRRGLVSVMATTAAGKQRYAVVDVPMAEALAFVGAATPDLVTPFLTGPVGTAA
jgi:putative membrane protein